jgi:hypothetical protein
MAGFSWPEAWFSRRTFYLSGENSVRFSATIQGRKPLCHMLKKIVLFREFHQNLEFVV